MRFRLAVAAFVLFSFALASAREDTPSKAASQKPRTLRLGAVAYSPSSVTIFRSIRYYLAQRDMPVEFILYSNYDEQIKALQDGQIDIAWNSPLAHGKFHLQAGDSQALLMRDVDCGYRVNLIVRKDADIASLSDLRGKTMVFGSCDSADATVLPVYFLKREGVNFDQVKILSLHCEVDAMGVPCHSQQHVMKALLAGRGQAGVIGVDMWKRLQSEKSQEAAQFKEIWTSPPFSHCVWTARKDFDKQTGERFTQLMMGMDGKDPLTAEVLKLEHCAKWVAGGQQAQDGFGYLLTALRQSPTLPFAPK